MLFTCVLSLYQPASLNGRAEFSTAVSDDNLNAISITPTPFAILEADKNASSDTSQPISPTPTMQLILYPTPRPTTHSLTDAPNPQPTNLQPSPSYFDPNRTYTIQARDTLLSVAIETSLELDTLFCLMPPGFTPDKPLVIGDTLSLPSPGTNCHKVDENETLSSVATLYNTEPGIILMETWNQTAYPFLRTFNENQTYLPAGIYVRIPPNTLNKNQVWETNSVTSFHAHNETSSKSSSKQADADVSGLMALLQQPIQPRPFLAYGISTNQTQNQFGQPSEKNVSPPVPPNWPYGSGNFSWPLYGWLTQDFHNEHRAIDIAAPLGTPISAADRGVVIRAGWNNQGYGFFVVIDHNIDYVTLYAHLSEIWVAEGDIIAQGQLLGVVGSTGNSTGPHLHFEIRDFGRRVDPIALLMR
ncbi:MAG: M23 family metallopeptidase [Chloroflexota bacterium]